MDPRGKTTRLLPWCIAVLLFAVACRESAAPPTVDKEPTQQGPKPAPRGLTCRPATVCAGAEITESDIAALKDHPERDQIQIRFDDTTTDAGFATITKLPWVRFVSISSLASVHDLSPVSELTELRRFSAKGWGITDLSPLGELTKLERIDVYNQQGTVDLAPLGEIGSLRTVEVILTAVENADALGRLGELQALELVNNGITDASFLVSLVKLERLSLQGNHIEDLSAAAKLPDLVDLTVTAMPVDQDDLAPFVSLRGWTHLGIRATKVSSLEFLAGNTELVSLDAEGCTGITSLRGLSNATKLRQLRLSGTRVTDLSMLSRMTDLVELWLHDTQVSDVSALAPLPLWGLGLSGTKVRDTSPLLKLPNMRSSLYLPAEVPDRDYEALVAAHPQANVTREAPPTLADLAR
jgi:hypothetical protein